MSLAIWFVGLGVLYFLCGECWLRLLSRRRASPDLHPLTQGLVCIFLGILFNTALTGVIVAFGPFSYLPLLLGDAILLVTTVKVVPDWVQGLALSRVVQIVKQRKGNEHLVKEIVLILSYGACGVGVYLHFWHLFSAGGHTQLHDIFTLVHKALTAIRRGWDFNQSSRYPFGYPDFFSVMVVPGLALDPGSWYATCTILFSMVQYSLFFAGILAVSFRVRCNFPHLVFVPFLTSTYLPTWLFYLHPSNWALILFCVLMLASLGGTRVQAKPKSGAGDERGPSTTRKPPSTAPISVVLFGLLLGIHFASLLWLGLPYLLAMAWKGRAGGNFKRTNMGTAGMAENPGTTTSKADAAKDMKQLAPRTQSRSRKRLFLSWASLFAGPILVILITLTLISSGGDFFTSYSAFGQEFAPPYLETWTYFSIGPAQIALFLAGAVLAGVPLLWKKTPYRFFWGCVIGMLVYNVLYLAFFDVTSRVVRTYYAFYRFFIYVDLSLLLLVPLIVGGARESIPRGALVHLQTQWRAWTRHHPRIPVHLRRLPQCGKWKRNWGPWSGTIKKRNAWGIFLVLCFSTSVVGLSLEKIEYNSRHEYGFPHFSSYWPEAHVAALQFTHEHITPNATVLFDEGNDIISFHYPTVSIYLGDAPLVDPAESRPYFDEARYNQTNARREANFQGFKTYVRSPSKRLVAGTLRIQSENYLIVDTHSNPELVSLILSDPDFVPVWGSNSSWGRVEFRVFLFKLQA